MQRSLAKAKDGEPLPLWKPDTLLNFPIFLTVHYCSLDLTPEMDDIIKRIQVRTLVLI
jgi:hypothetical protein